MLSVSSQLYFAVFPFYLLLLFILTFRLDKKHLSLATFLISICILLTIPMALLHGTSITSCIVNVASTLTCIVMVYIWGKKQTIERTENSEFPDPVFKKTSAYLAHELNNLSLVIIGNAQILTSQLNTQSRLLPITKTLHYSGEKAKHLADTLLSVAQNQILYPKTVDINVLVTDLKSTLEVTLDNNQTLELILDKDLWKIEVDPELFKQSLLNLINPVTEAQPTDGKISIQTQNSIITKETLPGFNLLEGKYVMLIIQYNDESITDSDKLHILEPFYTSQKISKTNGLGLTTSLGFVRQSGGDIIYESSPSKASKFTLILPTSNQ